MEHQLCDIIFRVGAEKIYMLVSKITLPPPMIYIRPKLLLLAESNSITVMFGDDVGSMLYTKKKISFYFPDLTYTEDRYPRCVSGGWMEVCTLHYPRLWPHAGTESTMLCLKKPCLRYSRIRLDLSAIYHRVRNWNRARGREEEKKGHAVFISITAWKNSLSYTAADILVSRKSNLSFHWKILKNGKCKWVQI